jgi:hypothetical protein
MIKVSTSLGRHDFAKISKAFEFGDGQGYVGRLFTSTDDDLTVISNLAALSPLKFLRKPNALLTGIQSILFFKTPIGLLEFGFHSPDGATLASKSTSLQRCLPIPFLNKLVVSTSADSLANCKSYLALQKTFTGPAATRAVMHQFIITPTTPTLPSPLAALQPSSVSPNLPSKGSQGHPHCCQAPCRFRSTARGCKDGEHCFRCHLCPYTRAMHREKTTTHLAKKS